MGLTSLPNDLDSNKIESSYTEKFKNVQEDKRLVVIKLSNQSAQNVQLIGSFTNWQDRIPMEKINDYFQASINLPAGEHYYKFILDDNWIYDESQDTVDDSFGGRNNIIRIEEYETNKAENTETTINESLKENDNTKEVSIEETFEKSQNIKEEMKDPKLFHKVVEEKIIEQAIGEILKEETVRDDEEILERDSEECFKKEYQNVEKETLIDETKVIFNQKVEKHEEETIRNKEEVIEEPGLLMNKLSETDKYECPEKEFQDSKIKEILIEEIEKIIKLDEEILESMEAKEDNKEPNASNNEEFQEVDDNCQVTEEIIKQRKITLKKENLTETSSKGIPMCLKVLSILAILFAVLLFIKK